MDILQAEECYLWIAMHRQDKCNEQQEGYYNLLKVI